MVRPKKPWSAFQLMFCGDVGNDSQVERNMAMEAQTAARHMSIEAVANTVFICFVGQTGTAVTWPAPLPPVALICVSAPDCPIIRADVEPRPNWTALGRRSGHTTEERAHIRFGRERSATCLMCPFVHFETQACCDKDTLHFNRRWRSWRAAQCSVRYSIVVILFKTPLNVVRSLKR